MRRSDRLKKHKFDPKTVTSDELEREYWRIVETGQEDVQVNISTYLHITMTIWKSLLGYSLSLEL